MTKFIKLTFLTLSLVAVFSSTNVQAITMDELRAEINSLKEEIMSLRNSLGAQVYSYIDNTSYGTGSTVGTSANSTTQTTTNNNNTQTTTGTTVTSGTNTTYGTQTINNTGYASPSGGTTPCSFGAIYNVVTGALCNTGVTNINSGTNVVTTTPSISNTTSVENATYISKYLSYGMTNDVEVKKLQDFLILYGYLEPGLNTGSYFGKTVSAVAKFQKGNAILGDGRNVGPKTMSAITKTQKELQPPVLPSGSVSLQRPTFLTGTNVSTTCITGISAPSISVVSSPTSQSVLKKGTEVMLTWTPCELGTVSQYKFYFRNYETLSATAVRFSIGGTLIPSVITASGSQLTAKVLVPQEIPVGFYDILVETTYGGSYVTKASSKFKVTTDACLSATSPTLATSWYVGSMRLSSPYNYNGQMPAMFAWDVCGNFPVASTGQIDIKRESDGVIQSVALSTPNDGYERVNLAVSNFTTGEYRFRFTSGTISSNWSSKFPILP